MFSNDQRFSILIIAVSALKIAEFLLCNNTDHGCFSSETVIFIEIHAMCINYQFWIILKNLFTSLNQSGVSLIILKVIRTSNRVANFSDRRVWTWDFEDKRLANETVVEKVGNRCARMQTNTTKKTRDCDLDPNYLKISTLVCLKIKQYP